MIRFRCTGCTQLLGVAARKVGHRVTCPTCKDKVVVPAALSRERSRLSSARSGLRTAPAKRKPAKQEEILELLALEEEIEVLEVLDELEVIEEPRRRPKPKPRSRQRRYVYDSYRESNYRKNSSFLTGSRLLGGLLVLFGLFVCCSGLGTASATGGAYSAGASAGAITGLLFAIGGLFKIIRG